MAITQPANTDGAFECDCADGFGGDGYECGDINECDDDDGGCEQGCENTVGGFTCRCNDYYELNEDGVRCDDINECLSGNVGCRSDEECINRGGAPDANAPKVLLTPVVLAERLSPSLSNALTLPTAMTQC